MKEALGLLFFKKGPKAPRRFCGCLFLAVVILAIAVCPLRAADGDGPAAVRIGLVNSLFKDVPQTLMNAMMQPFGAIMKAQTGVTGELVPGGDALKLGEMLATNQVQLGVFHGIEFAWVRMKHPELQPLVIAVNQDRHLRAHLVVREDNAANDFAGLKGKTLSLPRGTREHSRLFLQRHCRMCGGEPNLIFGKIAVPSNMEDALDDVVDDEAQAAIVDAVALESFKRRKPGRFAKLKSVQQSEVFPAGVVVYQPSALDAGMVQRFRDGMTNAHRNAMGKQMLTLWKLTCFEPVPDDYELNLTNIVKIYPPPAALPPKK